MPLSRLVPSRRSFLKVGLGAAGVVAVGGGGYGWFAHSAYSRGMRMGRLTTLYTDARIRRLYFSTLEGELTLGVNSSNATWRGSDGQQVENPWRFSGNADDFERWRSMLGRMVVIYYHQLQAPMTSFGGNTDYRVDDIVPVDPALGVQTIGTMSSSTARTEGDRLGRIVKLAEKGTVLTTYEATIQSGDGGNRFLEVSIPRAEVFEAAKGYLRSAKLAMLNMQSVILRNPTAQDSNISIIGIRPVE